MPKTKSTYSISTLRRLPAYLRELRTLSLRGQTVIASSTLARALAIDPVSVRKDMEILPLSGTQGIGYDVEDLISAIETFLGWKNTTDVILAGNGELGHALLGYHGFLTSGMKIVASFTPDGKSEKLLDLYSIPVFPYAELEHLTRRLGVRLAILSVPEEEAQKFAERLISAGILAIWNLTAQTLELPPEIICQQLNLTGDLALLSVKLAAKFRENPHLSER